MFLDPIALIMLVVIIFIGLCCALVYGRFEEWGELRRKFPCDDVSIGRGEKRYVYYKYRDSAYWRCWNYYHVHVENDYIYLTPPLFYKFFMPRLKIARDGTGTCVERKEKTNGKVRTVFEFEGCSVLLALDDK